MFTVNSMNKLAIEEFRHDILLNSSQDSLFEGTDRTFSPAYVELPYPVHRPLEASEEDAIKHLLDVKIDYNKLLERKRRLYHSDKKNIVEKKIANHEYMYLPKHLLEFYQKKDPDPYFKCDYNYYYTGGTLDNIEIESNEYLVRCDVENNLLLHDLYEKKEFKIINNNCVSPIFNINTVNSDNDTLLLLREKKYLNVVRLMGTTEMNQLFVHKYDVPLLDAKLNPRNIIHLGVIQANGKLSIRDVNTGRTVFSFKNHVEESDNFQRFRYLDENSVILANRFTVKLIDYRQKVESLCFEPNLIKCNSLCNFKTLDNNLLLASRHYVLKTDLRYLKDFSFYSHTLPTPPCYMDYTVINDDTFLCLANQNDGKVLFTGMAPYTLPFKVPSIQDTLKECRLRNSSLVFRDDLEQRFSFSLAGLKVVTLNNEAYIYTSNCLGEIFRQKVSNESPEAEKSVKAMFRFIDEIKQPEPVLHLTHVEEMSRARFSLNTKPIDSNLAKYKAKSKAQEFLTHFKARYSKKNVTSVLAKDFLSVWEDSEEEEEDEGKDLPEVPPTEKVNDWIRTHDFSDDDNSLGFNLSQTIVL